MESNLDGQDKSERRGLGLERLTGRQGSTPPERSEEEEGLYGVGGSVWACVCALISF